MEILEQFSSKICWARQLGLEYLAGGDCDIQILDQGWAVIQFPHPFIPRGFQDSQLFPRPLRLPRCISQKNNTNKSCYPVRSLRSVHPEEPLVHTQHEIWGSSPSHPDREAPEDPSFIYIADCSDSLDCWVCIDRHCLTARWRKGGQASQCL